MNHPDLKGALITEEQQESSENREHLAKLDKLEEEAQIETRGNAMTISFNSSSTLRKSILKPSGERRSKEKRLSFHENLKEVHEVENWKQYNTIKKSCCEACWDECSLI